MKNVISLGEKTGDGLYSDTTTLLREVVEMPEVSSYRKCVICLLDNDGGMYTTLLQAAGLRTSEIVALLEVAKQHYLNHLVGVRDGE